MSTLRAHSKWGTIKEGGRGGGGGSVENSIPEHHRCVLLVLPVQVPAARLCTRTDVGRTEEAGGASLEGPGQAGPGLREPVLGKHAALESRLRQSGRKLRPQRLGGHDLRHGDMPAFGTVPWPWPWLCLRLRLGSGLR